MILKNISNGYLLFCTKKEAMHKNKEAKKSGSKVVSIKVANKMYITSIISKIKGIQILPL